MSLNYEKRIKFEIESIFFILKACTEISADTIMNGFLKAGITDKTTTIEITAQDELVTEDIANDIETLPDGYDRRNLFLIRIRIIW